MAKKIYIGTLIVIISLIALALAGSPSEAREFSVLSLDETSIGYKSYLAGAHDPLINEHGPDNRMLDKQMTLQTNIDIFNYLYWDNSIHATTDKGADGSGGQFRAVGWQYQLGVRLSDHLKVEYEHHSQHILDWNRGQRFPTEDSIGFKLIIFKAKGDRETIF